MTKIVVASKPEVEEWLFHEFDPIRKAAFRRFLAPSAKVWALFTDDKLLCVWGLIPPTLMSDFAYLWLHTTPELDKHQFIFIRQSQIAFKEMLAMYPTIYGHNTGADERSVRWLKWLGAKFFEPTEDGVMPFMIGGN